MDRPVFIRFSVPRAQKWEKRPKTFFFFFVIITLAATSLLKRKLFE